MRIAVTYDNGNIFQHFGQTEQFKIYDIEDGEVTLTNTIDTGEHSHGALADLLKKINVSTLICGGIGRGAKQALADAGINLYCGATGNVDQAIEDYISGNLEYNPDSDCNHHQYNNGNCGQHGPHNQCQC